MATILRNKTLHPDLGYPTELNNSCLPWNSDVFNYFTKLRQEIISNGDSNPSVRGVAKLVMVGVLEVWDKSNLVKWRRRINSDGELEVDGNGNYLIERTNVITEKRILDKIEKIYKDGIKLLKWQREKKDNFTCDTHINLKESFQQLFDVMCCRCELTERACNTCTVEMRIPDLEIPFIIDQRSKREMFISGIDRKGTEIYEKRGKRQEMRENQEVGEEKRRKLHEAQPIVDEDQFSEIFDNEDDLSDSLDGLTTIEDISENDPKHNVRKLPKLARMCDRYGISDRAGAAIANAVLQDYGIIAKHNPRDVIDRSKLCRERERLGKIAEEENLEKNYGEIMGLYYDGRIDKTLVRVEREDGKVKCQTQKESHEVIIAEPGSRYIDHISPKSGKAKDVATEIIDVINEISADVVVLGCDGTPVNTGPHGGINRIIELKLGHPCQRAVCGIHTNELILKHIFKDSDGNSSGPTSYSGPIGRIISEDLTKYPLVQFQAIAGKVEEISSEMVCTFSTDYRYLYEISIAIQIGPEKINERLLIKNPGTLNHARWNTLANRILRLYISTLHPSNDLKRLVNFILKQYVPGWIQFKRFWEISSGATNFFQLVQLSRDLPPQDMKIAHEVLQTNGFWSHPENILISMLTDSCRSVREKAVNCILTHRYSSINTIDTLFEPRKFIVPKINFGADCYWNLVDIDTTLITEPPLTTLVSDQDLQSAIEKALIFPPYPCHSQAVERWVKEVTQASQKRYGQQSRHRFILNRARCREEYPVFNRKQDYYGVNID